MARAQEPPIQLPRQAMPAGRGVAGYRGNVVVVDPTTAGIPLVADEAPDSDDRPVPAAKGAAVRSRKVAKQA